MDNSIRIAFIAILLSICSIVSAEIVDSDNDGLDDSWEIEHFGNLTQTSEGEVDGDGFTNLEEFYAETDPSDHSSSPAVTRVDFESGAKPVYWGPYSSYNRWALTQDNPISGSQSLRSYPQAVSQRSSEVEIKVTTEKGFISFDYSAQNPDYCCDQYNLYINGNHVKSFSQGEGRAVFPLEAGVNKVRWRYYRGNNPNGTFIIDNVVITAVEPSADVDTDNDGLSNLAEWQLGTDATDADTDNDGMQDGWEHTHGFALLDPSDGVQDRDNDGFTNEEESYAETDPSDPNNSPAVTRVDFESGAKPMYWGPNSSYNRWALTQDNPISGSQSLRSYPQAVSQRSSEVEIKVTTEKGFISFDYSAQNPDYCCDQYNLYINGNHVKSFSQGEGRAVFPLEAGVNKVRWRYYRGNNPNGTFIIDNVVITAVEPSADVDTDNDGLSNLEEWQLGTDATDADTDNDGMQDGWEHTHGFALLDPSDGVQDRDNDGFTNEEEFYAETDPSDPNNSPAVTRVDFESGAKPMYWGPYSNSNRWVLTQDTPISGSQSLRSYPQAVSQRSSEVEIKVTTEKGFISFDYSAQNPDYCCDQYNLYINGNHVKSFSQGEGRAVFPLEAGVNKVRWRYYRGNNPNGTFIIDNVVITAVEPSADVDTDNDGLSNLEEWQLGTDATDADTDNDGMQDGWEHTHGFALLDPSDGVQDRDNDGFTNEEEFYSETDPSDPNNSPAVTRVDFESGAKPMYWGPNSSYNRWVLTQDTPISGSQSLRSYPEAVNQRYSEVVVKVANEKGFISFDYSAQNPDYMHDSYQFFVNNRVVKAFSRGEGRAVIPLAAGTNSLRWRYVRGSTPNGSFTIDNVVITAVEPSADVDTDNDGLSNLEEWQLGTDATDADTDNDGMQDGWEHTHGFALLDPSDGVQDRDNDGFTNEEEFYAETDPSDPNNSPAVTRVDFESGAKPMYWGPNSSYNRWVLTQDTPISGSQSLRSYPEAVNQRYSEVVVKVANEKGFISFDYSAQNPDYMHDSYQFFVNNRVVKAFSRGEGRAVIPLAAGTNSLRWRYVRGSTPNGSFTIDNVVITAVEPSADVDTDNDGLSNLEEWQLGTDATDADTDNDGMQDGWEHTHGFALLDPSDGVQDRDNDGFTNEEEFYAETDPSDPNNSPAVTRVDFESGAKPMYWGPNSSYNRWVLTQDTPISGSQSLRSYPEAVNQRYSEVVVKVANEKGFISFDYSAQNPDYMHDSYQFFVNNRVVKAFSRGEGRAVIPLAAGTNSLRWRYVRGSTPNGSFTIDNVVITAVEPSADVDTDNDGLSNLEEWQLGTDATDADTDNDGMQDGWEHTHGFALLDPSDGVQDRDNDGFTNEEEFYSETDPSDPNNSPAVTRVDFESGAKPMYWGPYSNTNPWSVTQEQPLSGTQSLATTGSGSTYTSSTEIKVLTEKGFISFDYASENDGYAYDRYYVYLNGNYVKQFSRGSSGRVVLELGAGVNTLRWYYHNRTGAPDGRFVIDNVVITVADTDTDNDGMDDSWELYYFGKLEQTAEGDPDSDGLTNIEEFQNDTHPKKLDTDGDGISDGWEVEHGFDPNDSTDGVMDSDGDGFTNQEESYALTDPHDASSYPAVTLVDFESGAKPMHWRAYSNTTPWSLTQEQPLSGSQSLVATGSGSTYDSSSIEIKILSEKGFISFDYSAENDGYAYDHYYVYLNGNLVKSFSRGSSGRAVIELSAGANTLRWYYHNRSSAYNGRFAIDNVMITAVEPSDEADSDSDGLTDNEEWQLGTNAESSDTDDDSIPDPWEVTHGFDPLDSNDAYDDPDLDGFTNADEFWGNTDPNSDSSFPKGVQVGFEGTEIQPLEWSMGGNTDWFITDGLASSGLQSLQSGEVSAGQTSEVQVMLNSYDGFVRFDARLENSCFYNNKLTVYIDGELEYSIINKDVTHFKAHYIKLEQGLREIRWVYEADRVCDSSANRAFIDNIFITADSEYDATPPGPVAINLSSATSGTEVDINWGDYDELSNGGDIASFSIYQSDTAFNNIADATFVAKISGNSRQYQVQNLTRDTEYHFAVVATDISGNVDPNVTSYSITTVDTQAPMDVGAINVVSYKDSAALTWAASASDDVASYQVIVNNTSTVSVPSSQLSYTITGLSPSTVHDVRVKAVDNHGNISSGTYKRVATLYNNPEINYAEALSGKVHLTWNSAGPALGIWNYRIYVSEQPITDISKISPVLSRSSSYTDATIAQLTNGKTYYFAVAVRNINGYEDSVVTSVLATPGDDTQGPNITSIKWNGAELADNTTFTNNGVLSVAASDQSGVSRVTVHIDGNLHSTIFNSGASFDTSISMESLTDGTHIIAITAYDTLDLTNEESRSIIVDLAPPAAPEITSPAADIATNEETLKLEGQGSGSDYQVFNNGQNVSDWTSFNDGTFSHDVTLTEGENKLTVKTRNRGGESPLSNVRTITLDSTVPESPTGLIAQSKEAGQITLTWNPVNDTNVAGYDIYRSDVEFVDINNAQRINNNHLTKTSFTDLPFHDGNYFYRVVAINDIETPSVPSNMVTGIADSLAPTASISYEPLGKHDGVNNVYGQGDVKVTLDVSEQLLTTPFLAIKPANASIRMLNLEKVSDTQYSAVFTIDDSNQTGQTVATFSARDRVGNQGTEVVEGKSIVIDASGPAVAEMTLSPTHPIKNSEQEPVSITINLKLSEAIKAGEFPTLQYALSNSAPDFVEINNISQVDDLNWSASVTLPSTAGLEVAELLQFNYSGVDALDNESNQLPSDLQFQVYQGDLPPLDTPFGLKASATQNGIIELSWYAVPEASAYQIYRQAPGETSLTAYQRVEDATSFADQTQSDDVYQYAIASIRSANGEETFSAQSEVVSASSDSVQPDAPTNLELELTPVGVQVTWELSASDDIESYSLYRAETQPITTIDGLEPTIEGIPASSPSVVDPEPMQNLPAYVVVAVDKVGNTSEPSNTGYLNIDLLPVSNLKVVQSNAEHPVISWTHNSNDLLGYDFYLGDKETGLKLNQEPLVTPEYVDTGFANQSRQYSIVAIDNNAVESMARTITLPEVDISLNEGEVITKNVINEVSFTVTNRSDSTITNSRLLMTIAGKQHTSQPFAIEPATSEQVDLIVGGYSSLSPLTQYQVALVSQPNQGEEVRIEREKDIEVVAGSLVLNLETQDFLRGGKGQMRFSLENTGQAMMEIITALNSGNKNSPDIKLLLKDLDGNVLTTQDFRQSVGEGVITLPTKETVARIESGNKFTTDWFEMDVPAAAPENVVLELKINKIHRDVGKETHVELQGVNTTTQLSLIDTPYTGGAVVITPESSFGDEDIQIAGKAIERETTQPLAFVPLKVVINVNGFEKIADVTTDSEGAFTHLYSPESGEAGIYKVSVIHPELTDRPEHGTFVISKVIINPNNLNVTIPKNYSQQLPLTVRAGSGTELTNVRFELRAQDQTDGVLPEDISLEFAAPVSLSSGQYKKLAATMIAGDNALEQGQFKIALISDESGAEPLGFATVKYSLTEATPALYYAPSFVETGLTLDGQVTESITLENRGVDAMRDIQLELLRNDDYSAPSWISLTVANNFGELAVGEKRPVGINIMPQGQVAPGVYEMKLRVLSSNHPTRDIPIYVSITESGQGGYQFKVSDMYTATLDDNGNLIQGLSGATIRMQNEDVPSIEYSLTTDNIGEAYFEDIPAGQYSYWVSANKHQEKHGRVQVRPGIVRNESVFLDYNLISLEWSVREITIEDRYEIILTATYEVDVPAAVVVLEPSSVTLPDMEPGDVFYGELSLTNHGLIRAHNIDYSFPSTNQYFQVDMMTSALPDSLEAKEVASIPYRITALESLEPEVDGSGGGCYTLRMCFGSKADYTCANGDDSNTQSQTCWIKSYGICEPGGGGGGGGGWFGGGGGYGGGGYGGGDNDPDQEPLPQCRVPCEDCEAKANGGGDQ
ncbi:fibronectin type III domain-containing protein [Kangiella sp. M94]